MPTQFQQKVYREVRKIKRGKIKSYGEIAKILKTSARAVGQALKRNRIKKVPCHRIICSNGKLGGYNRGVRLKAKILKQEGIKVNRGGI